ncbi:MAG: hypothetical protein IJ770_02230 [Alphaproteobacteria bacterium]|nr:hypothetical protein [Alphaproteobacteria bacterium]
MLMFAFSTAVFSTVMWLIYAVMFVRANLADTTLLEQDGTTMLTLLAIVILPILTVWMVFGYLNQFLINRIMNRKQSELLVQLQKNQDYTDLVVRVMLDAEHEIKDGFVLNKFDVFISDMNETLSEIIQRCNIASSAQLEQLWQRVQRGEKWSLGKAILDASKNQNTFDAWVREKANRDKVFRGSLLEFCSRYQSLLMMLEKHDRDKIFLKIIESGVFGKVYSIIAPLSDGIKDLRATTNTQNISQTQPEKRTSDYASVLKLASMEEPKAPESIMNVDKNDEEPEEQANDEEVYEEYAKRPSFFERLNPFRKPEPESPFMLDDEPDPFFQALHKGFQGGNVKEDDIEPSFGTENAVEEQLSQLSAQREPASMFANTNATETSSAASFGHSQNILNNLRATNENRASSVISQSQQPVPAVSQARREPDLGTTVNSAAPAVKTVAAEEKDEDLVYPFGGWTDESNYHG